jgi:hypothetical protein
MNCTTSRMNEDFRCALDTQNFQQRTPHGAALLSNSHWAWLDSKFSSKRHTAIESRTAANTRELSAFSITEGHHTKCNSGTSQSQPSPTRIIQQVASRRAERARTLPARTLAPGARIPGQALCFLPGPQHPLRLSSQPYRRPLWSTDGFSGWTNCRCNSAHTPTPTPAGPHQCIDLCKPLVSTEWNSTQKSEMYMIRCDKLCM